MFEEILSHPCYLARHNSAPFALERARYLQHLKGEGYSAQTLAVYAAALMRVVRWIDAATPVTTQQIEAAADRAGYLDDREQSPRRRFIWMARAWLKFSNRLLPELQDPVPFAELIADFSLWMAEARGISRGTIKRRSANMGAFFRWIHSRRGFFHEVRITDIDDYLVLATGRWCRQTVASKVGDIQAFFRYAGRRGWCSPAIAEAIQRPRIYEHERLPSAPTWDQVEKLFSSIPKIRPVDFRDRATFMLLAVYGLRASEVAALHLDDLDWEHDQIRIRRPKCRDAKLCPLVPTVGNAIIEYLEKARPRSTRTELFLELQAPFRPMYAWALGQAVSRRIEKLKLPLVHKGSHSLRHACATHLLGEGFSIKEIGDHLGHLSPKSTRIYAKVDLAGLRTVGDFDIGGLL